MKLGHRVVHVFLCCVIRRAFLIFIEVRLKTKL